MSTKFVEDILSPPKEDSSSTTSNGEDIFVSLGLFDDKSASSSLTPSQIISAHELIENELSSNNFATQQISAIKENAKSQHEHIRDQKIQTRKQYCEVRNELRSLFGERLVAFAMNESRCANQLQANSNHNNNSNNIVSSSEIPATSHHRQPSFSGGSWLASSQQPQQQQRQSSFLGFGGQNSQSQSQHLPLTPLMFEAAGSSNPNSISCSQQSDGPNPRTPLLMGSETTGGCSNASNTFDNNHNTTEEETRRHRQNRLACVECECLVGTYARLVVTQRNLNHQRHIARRRQRTSNELAADEKYSVLEQTLGLPIGTMSTVLLDTGKQRKAETTSRRETFASLAMQRDLEKHVVGNVFPVIEKQMERARNNNDM